MAEQQGQGQKPTQLFLRLDALAKSSEYLGRLREQLDETYSLVRKHNLQEGNFPGGDLAWEALLALYYQRISQLSDRIKVAEASVFEYMTRIAEKYER